MHHVRPRQRGPGQLGQIDAGLVLDRLCGVECLLRGFDGVGGQRGERVNGHPVEFVERVLPAEGPQMDALADVGQERKVVTPAAVQVVQHDQPADLLQLLLGILTEILGQLGVALG